jgi:pyruvate dehydrogenase E2 component (dihydrolipoamide acetyltransferase)
MIRLSVARGAAVSRSLSSALPAGATVLTMPALSPTMEMGNVVSWDVAVGDKVIAGAELAQIETDKAQLALDALDDGYVAAILVEAGARDVKVGAPICIIVEEEADIAAAKGYVPEDDSAEESTEAPPAAPKAAPSAPPAAEKQPQQQQQQQQQQQSKASPSSLAASSAPTSGGQLRATPAARALARALKLDLGSIRGSGPGGRIVLEDVEGAGSGKSIGAAAGGAAAGGVPSAVAPASGSFEAIPNSNVRRVIASRLTESKQTVPHFYLTVDVELTTAMKLRADLNAEAAKAAKGGEPPAYRLSLNDFVLKACASALRAHPGVNAQWGDDAIRQYADVDISVAVDSPAGLTTPIVRSADRLGLAAISATVKELAGKAAARKLVPEDYQGGTFSVSNLGMFGVKQFAAIINPPQACILAVGAARDEVVPAPAGDGTFVTRKVMSVTLSCDHRVVDGALGARWLQRFKANMENPVNMIM